MHNLLTAIKHTRLLNRNTGTPQTIKGTILDMQGFESARFIVGFQTVVNDASVTFRLAQADTNATGDMVVSDATSGAIISDGTTIALSNKELILDVIGVQKRYLEIQVVIGAQNAPIDYIVADQYPAGMQPLASQGASVHASTTKLNPAAA